MQSERTTFEALNSALRFAASRSAITSAEELAIIAAWNTRASDAEIARLTEALRAAEKREKALREDADRYHWLRDHSCPPHNFYISVPDEFAATRYATNEVDAYIDAARAVLKEQPHD